MDNEVTLNQLIKLGSDHKLLDTNIISDGYHTFGELYQHRIAIYMALCCTIAHNPINHGNDHYRVWKSKVHSDGSTMEGWFVMGISVVPGYQITYHLPEAKWEECFFAETMDTAPHYDGHTSRDVITRLQQL